jgi:predicted esterase
MKSDGFARLAHASLVTTGLGPHAGQPVATWGAVIGEAEAVMILLHGRGGSAADMLDLAPMLATTRVAARAPEAQGQTWYPRRFTDPVRLNEPYLGSALSVVDSLIGSALAQGVSGERIALVGFSQGACLALECAVRRAGPPGAVIAFSGGLIGDVIDPSLYATHPEMSVFLGCSEQDPHIPLARVRETAAVLTALGADVETRIYPGASHGINQQELDKARRLVLGLGRG